MSKIESVLALSQFNSHSILQDGLVTLESITSGESFNDEERDARFSYSLSANLHEAIEFSVETLVSLGHLSIDIDYWIGPVAELCRSFNRILCTKGEYLWERSKRQNSDRKLCVLR
jgi:hypothetical protein